jgi:hypothetical protein
MKSQMTKIIQKLKYVAIIFETCGGMVCQVKPTMDAAFCTQKGPENLWKAGGIVAGRPTSVFLKHVLMLMVMGWFKSPPGLS